MTVESLEQVRELYDHAAVVSDIRPRDALSAGRYLREQGYTALTGIVQCAEAVVPPKLPLSSPEAELLADPEVEVAVIIRAGHVVVHGNRVLDEPEPPKPSYAPRTVADLLGDIEVNMQSANAVTDADGTRDQFIAGPHIQELKDGRLASRIGIQVWQAPARRPDPVD